MPLIHSATALQSMEIATDTILSGKAKVMVAGGYDDICEEGSYEFANMKATSNAETELAMGREPTEMSRPATTSRAGVSSYEMTIPIFLTNISSSWNLKYVRLSRKDLPLISLLGHRFPHCDECKDCLGVRSSNSWYFGIYFNLHVRFLFTPNGCWM